MSLFSMSAFLLSPFTAEEVTVSVHIAPEELADAAEGLLDPARSAVVEAHLLGCDACTQVVIELTQVSVSLAAVPTPPMPDEVFARLADVVAKESHHRTSGAAAAEAARRQERAEAHRPHLGDFGADLPLSSKTRFLYRALLACVLAAVVGFGGYVMSASIGLNEPSADQPAFVDSNRLGAEASAVKAARDLEVHRFSKAWTCARGVTQGRITGITTAVVDGNPAYLVYTRADSVTSVTVVSGCDGPSPAAGPSATLQR